MAPRLARLALRYGWPCWLPGDPTCRSDGPIPPPPLAPAQPITFDGSAAPFLLTGWGPAGPESMWTVGDAAGLHARLSGPADTLVLTAAAFMPPGAAPLDVTVEMDGRAIADLRYADGAVRTDRLPLPAKTDGAHDIWLAIHDPRRPSRWGSADARPLGLRVESVTLR